MALPFFKKTFTYAGIGSRNIHISVEHDMFRLAKALEKKCYILNSGGAEGSDSAFERGVSDPAMKQIFLPWPGFRGKYPEEGNGYLLGEYDELAFEITRKFYHTPKRLDPSSKHFEPTVAKFMTRNVYQVLGKDLMTPVDFVICYTSDGKFSGGTGQALRIADHYGIEIFNLYQFNTDREIVERFL